MCYATGTLRLSIVRGKCCWTEYFALLPPNEVVVEIQETVAADEEVKEACKRLKRGGYSIALDNFVAGDDREALVPMPTSSKSTSGR